MLDQFARHEDTAQRNWAVALHAYHNALNTYRRVLEYKALRESRPAPTASKPAIMTTPPVMVSRRELQGLTRRECEVADLIARGYSNQQIADSLVLTRGTVANHVAHILSKVGAANRTQVAARVFSSRAASPDGTH